MSTPATAPRRMATGRACQKFQSKKPQLRRGEDGDGIGADGEEGHVPQVKHAGETDDDVQAEPEQDVEADDGQHFTQEKAQDLGQDQQNEPAEQQPGPCSGGAGHRRRVFALAL